MDIMIVGAGNMGRGIATRILAAGHPVHITDQDIQAAQKLAADLNDDATGALFEGPEDAHVVILALPYPANVNVATEWAQELAGKVVVDIANPVDFDTMDALVTRGAESSAEEVAGAAPAARVVKAFNTTFATTLIKDEPLDLFVAGNDDAACETVADLVRDARMRPIRVGHLKHARSLEGMQLLAMKVQQQIGGGFTTRLSLQEG